MLHIIKPDDQTANAALLEDMFEMRDRVVVGEWGWDIPGAQPGREKDQFDTPNTAYFIATGEAGTPTEGRVLACGRLNPTTSPIMLGELFSSFCDLQDCPVGPNVWECSRYFSDNGLCGNRLAGKRARSLVNLGMIKFALETGIDTFVWLIHQMIYGHMIAVWDSEPLGRPRREADEDYAWVAGRSTINQATLERVETIIASIDASMLPGGATAASLAAN